jgi:hypothetical protein
MVVLFALACVSGCNHPGPAKATELPLGTGTEEVNFKAAGGWNRGLPAHSVKLDAGARYLLTFRLNCNRLDKYGAIFLIAEGSSGAKSVVSFYPGAFNRFVDVQKVIEVAKGAEDAKVHFGSHGEAEYTVTHIQAVKLEDLSLELELPDEDSIAIFDPSVGCPLEFRVINKSGRKYTGPLRVQVVDARNESAVHRDLGTVDANIADNASQRFSLGGFKAPAGLYLLRVFSDTKCVFMQYRIAMTIPNRRWEDGEADRFFFGLHMPHYALWDFPKRIQKLKAANLLEHVGVGITRIKCVWNEDRSGRLDFQTLDAALSILKDRNIHVLAQLNNVVPEQFVGEHKLPPREEFERRAPSWFKYERVLSRSSWQWRSVKPSDMNAMARFATALAEKLDHHGVTYVELGNEPDWWGFWIGDFQDYSDTYTVRADAMKNVNPDFRIMNGGLVLNKTVDEKFLEKLLEAQGNRLDAVAFHSYDRTDDELTGSSAKGTVSAEGERGVDMTRLGELEDVMGKMGVDKPIWMTEGNVYTQTEYTVAKEVAKKFATYKLHRIQNCTYYRAISDDHLGFQLMTKNFEVCMPAVAYSTTVRFLRNKKASTAELPDGFLGVKCEDVHVVWSDAQNCAERREFKHGMGKPVDVYDFLGKKITSSGSGRLKLSIGSEPVFIVER